MMMIRTRKFELLVMIILVCFISLGAPTDVSPVPDCLAILTEMEPCLPFVLSPGASPTPDCCSSLLDVHVKSPVCLCELIAVPNGSSSRPGINLTLALELPAACSVDANPARCPALLQEYAPHAGLPNQLPVPSSADTGTEQSSQASKQPNSSNSSPKHSRKSTVLGSYALWLYLLLGPL
ncbi:hypothetical protein O6H91_01G143600 [Diphasiastrum complanatum]|uniref:Uncharacterized protein n=1 Tax=Diphasiastrum complanatum TaxID=34168 RepID=A0ACC2EWU0_DIPCM|nr:hypothetical protein O6H91_01G143600 [Diphasiastrum complanatum]